ncbi:MAG TPA: PEP-CTERM sorting domain-containing protein [Bryobacteraceae bacterium]|nr:PEP-CTERM sorting domain-containing protein [Bryobacteraceae bacterium]
MRLRLLLPLSLATVLALPACADSFFFSTGNPDGKMAAASRPDTGVFEIETGDDFVLSTQTAIHSATFVGLLTGGATASDIGEVRVEIYRIFPKDSDVGRTSGPPTFSTAQVPTRVNSPSDVAFDDRDTASANLSLTTSLLSASFTTLNSVQLGGIHPKPNQTTGGDGAATGEEVQFDVTFSTPFDLPADHYFFIPQVEVSGGDFLWLSAPRPIVAPGTPFPAGSTDLQAWTRDQFLDPDWLRIGTDIVGPPATGGPAPTFNMTFSLTGETVPEPSSCILLGSALLAFAAAGRKKLHRG